MTMLSNSVFTLPEIILFITGFLIMLCAVGFALFGTLRGKRAQEEQHIRWYRQPRTLRSIGLSVFAFFLALIMIANAFVMYYRLSLLFIFFITFFGIILIILCGFIFIILSMKNMHL